MTELTEDGKFRRAKDNPGSLISTDLSGLEAYKRRKTNQNVINKRIETLENNVSEILNLLKSIVRDK